MSDMFDHEADPWDQRMAIEDAGGSIHEGCDDGAYRKARKFHINRQYGPLGNRMRQRPDDRVELRPEVFAFPMEEAQPEYQQFHVESMHSETQKSWLVSGTVHFDPEYYGYRKFHFERIWLPKSRCEATGNCIRVPQWLIKNRFRDKTHKKDHRQKFGGLIAKADSLVGKRIIFDIKTLTDGFDDGYPCFVGMRRPFYEPPF